LVVCCNLLRLGTPVKSDINVEVSFRLYN